MSKSISIFIITLLFLASCKEKKIVDVKSRIRFINASSISGNVNLYIDYQKIYETDVQYLNYSKYREYITTKRKVQIKNTAQQTIIDTAVDLEQNKAYTIILYDSSNTVLYKLVKEEYLPSGGSSCKIRFLHLSNNALEVNVTQDTSSYIHFVNFTNGDQSEYTNFNSGLHYFNVSGSNISYTQPLIDLKPGNFYTMYLKGNVLSTGADSVGIFTIENNANYE
jgi:hypothetical protein